MIRPGPVKGAVVRRRERGSGCGGRGRRRRERQSQGGSNRERGAARVTNGAGAYGKTVWSWLSLLQSSFRGDASTQPGLMYRQSAERRRQERIRLREERAISRRTTAQGRPGVSGFTCGFPLCIACAMFSTGAMGASRHPVFPAPSALDEGKRQKQASGKTCRENAKARLSPTASLINNASVNNESPSGERDARGGCNVRRDSP